jgi:putative oxidoreductase
MTGRGCHDRCPHPGDARGIHAREALLLLALERLEAIPYAVLAVPLRLGVAWIFWNSAQVKLLNWETTLAMFRDDYQVPVLPPDLAANIALAIELTAPVLLVLGFLTRLAILVLFGMTAVIQIFVYPEAWPTHLQWGAMMLVLLSRGAGRLSLDYPLWRWLRPRLA